MKISKKENNKEKMIFTTPFKQPNYPNIAKEITENPYTKATFIIYILNMQERESGKTASLFNAWKNLYEA
ncbi:MAG: hypothetical protein LBH04_06055 [Tannerellaceae bacterium]|jgi:hypothetical protein|nr:hypothetical protein [Tannerellaceae bacterium]